MITFAENKTNAVSFIGIYTKEEVEQKFLEMIPTITLAVKRAFREYDPDKREDALECVLVQSYLNLRSLAEKGRLDEAYPSPVAKFAIASYKDGRPAGFESSSTDVLAERTKLKGRVEVEPIEPYDDKRHSWSECFVTDGRMNVANEVCFKLDCEAWMNTLDWKHREILERMIQGDTTQELSKQFSLSPARISQLRRKFVDSWKEFRNGYERKHENDNFIEELKVLAEKMDSPAN